ncbi:Centrin-1 [Ceratocystis fimbriata CBS 114723]|uniref:Centrin-1 n=1 Tax=Ceratocystis fimbriata CBS 114723 TaxID=1035309 RepID=A0A2C5WY87_9PEZI|nr:Centrin-1 [Ceratocystis fimbriata CBS 114723]
MAPKRKAQAISTGEKTTSAPRQRLSKLAKEHNVTAQEESEIREAFSLFSEPMKGEKDGVIPTPDVRAAMVALGIPPRDGDELAEFLSILDPDNEGFASFEPFFAICALKFHARDNDEDTHSNELDEAFALFTNTYSAGAGADEDGCITIAHLKRVAALLKEDVSDDLLRDMVLEANGGAGVSAGVQKEEFDSVMRRAGVWR